MTLDFAALLDAPVYAQLGVTVTLSTATKGPETLSGRPRNEEVLEPGQSSVAVPTVRRAVILRRAELGEKGFDDTDLDDARLAMNGVDYKVYATGPAAEEREIALFLVLDK